MVIFKKGDMMEFNQEDFLLRKIQYIEKRIKDLGVKDLELSFILNDIILDLTAKRDLRKFKEGKK